MIYECNICQKLLYVEEEFVDHIKTLHLDEVNDEIGVMSELITFYSDLKKARQQDMVDGEAQSATPKENYCFYGEKGEKLIFSK